MTHPCPNCGGKLKQHRTRQVGSLIRRRRDCTECGYGDEVTVRPETIVSVLRVFRRRKADPPQRRDAV